MKIVFVTLFYPPAHFGGTETYTHGLAKYLQQLGHQVRVLCAEDWGAGSLYWNGVTDELFDGVPVRRLHLNWTKAPNVNDSLFDNPVVGAQFADYLAEWQPDVVHVTSCQTLSVSVIAQAKRAGVPVVVTLTDFWFMCPRVTLLKSDGEICDGQVEDWECIECLMRGAKFRRWSSSLFPASVHQELLQVTSRQAWLTRYSGLRGMALDIPKRRHRLRDALAQADRVLIASRAALELFRGAGFTVPIEVVPYGHDLSWLGSYAGKTPSPELRFAFIGQISEMKGPHLLIRAFRELRLTRPARLVIYGALNKEPVFAGELRALAEGCAGIEFRGTYPHAASAQVFADLDVLVVPSLWYDYPLIINEAFATGTPVITSNFGGMREFVEHNVNGLLFERGNVQALRHEMQRLLDEPPLLGQLERQIPPVIRMQAAAEQMSRLYMQVVESTHVTESNFSG